MHHPRCRDPRSQTPPTPQEPWERGNCLLGEDGHCDRCPFRGYRTDPRWGRINRVGAFIGYMGRGGSLAEIPEDVACVLWPVGEREWIAREGCWTERAEYHFAMLWRATLREVLQESYDLRRASNLRSKRAFGWRAVELLALYPVRLAADIVFGPAEPLPPDYVSPTTGRRER